MIFYNDMYVTSGNKVCIYGKKTAKEESKLFIFD